MNLSNTINDFIQLDYCLENVTLHYFGSQHISHLVHVNIQTLVWPRHIYTHLGKAGREAAADTVPRARVAASS